MSRRRARFAAALGVCLLLHPTASQATPEAHARSTRFMLQRDSDFVFPLDAKVDIPCGGELHWPLTVAESAGLSAVESVEVDVRNLRHPSAARLTAELLSRDRAAVLSSPTTRDLPIGLPARPRRPDVVGYGFALPHPVPGEGHDFSYADLVATTPNLAVGRAAQQSSTAFEGDAERAVDGNVDGVFARGSVTHTGGHGSSDPEPWWSVDLGSATSVGTVKLWARTPRPMRREVQAVVVDADPTHGSIAGGSFVLRVSYDGLQLSTQPISVRAVATVEDERPAAAAGSGEAPGESMQARLQALSHLHLVAVTRLERPGAGGYEWLVTFLSALGDLPLMEVQLASVQHPAATVQVRPVRDGQGSVWVDDDGKVHQLRGLLGPAWVMLLDDDAQNGTLAEATAAAKWVVPVPGDGRREYTFDTGGVVARYLRVQRADEQYLSIAEVQAFAARPATLARYEGGAPLRAGEYDAEETLAVRFGGLPATGTWVLRLRDSHPADPSRACGALSDWVLRITDSDGGSLHAYPDLAATVTSLPRHGQVFWADPGTSLFTQPILARPGFERLVVRCGPTTACDAPRGVGTTATSAEQGPGAEHNALVGDRLLMYRPDAGFVGEDTVRFVVTLSGAVSREAEVALSVRDCAGQWCGSVLW